MQQNAFSERVALVTGASRGIGAAMARQLAAGGAHVILVARSLGGLEAVDDEIREAGNHPATLVPMDLKQHDLIDQLASTIYQRWGKLDILVGNAGTLGALTPLAHADPKIWDEVFGVNVTANYRLIRSMDPLLRQSDAGRAVFVTSGAARTATAYWGPYAASKAALEHMIHIYAQELEGSSVRANLFDPGIVRTKMRAQAFPGEAKDRLADPADIAKQMLDLLTVKCSQQGDTILAA
ncbi:MAG: oxidoreductase [Rickettsiales bacterium]|nr:oxidoreductase [Rickettsiales bacterium]